VCLWIPFLSLACCSLSVLSCPWRVGGLAILVAAALIASLLRGVSSLGFGTIALALWRI
jgi:hypothetical protein